MRFSNASTILVRALALRCPACGRGKVYESGFKTAKRCSSCGMIFEREQGYFVGAIYINVLATEVILGIIYFTLLLYSGISEKITDYITFALALCLPVLFYRHTKSLWLSFDYFIDPSKKFTKNRV